VSVVADNLVRIYGLLGDVNLIAVSKTQSIEKIREALSAGQRVFGENRVQEAEKKFFLLRTDYPDIELHLIGALQTNKVRAAVELFNVIQTVDRPALAEALARAIKKTRRRPRLYIEVNIGKEPQKAGVTPEKIEEFLIYCREKCELEISGLMCIPPQDQNPRPFFQRMRKLADQFSLPHLSMGMSADFEIAVECGATEIRVGTGVFGVRG